MTTTARTARGESTTPAECGHVDGVASRIGRDVGDVGAARPSAPDNGASMIESRFVDFEGLLIEYDDRVLVPRPWTAEQSRWAARLIRTGPPGPVLELCAAAGQIGLLAATLSPRPLVSVDTVSVDLPARSGPARSRLHDEAPDVRAR
jgi:hypothetical protein